MLIVYTSVFGTTDPLHEPLVTEGAQFVCFTDRPLRSRHWAIVRVPRVPAPCRASRTLKAMSHALFPQAAATLWQDANFCLRVAPQRLLQLYPDPITTFRHCWRARITEEADEIVRLGKARPETTYAQLAAYQAAGFDTDAQPMRELSGNGVILRQHTEAVKRFNERWCAELQRWTLRDQMSADYVAWTLGLSIARFEGTHLRNPYFTFTPYKRAVSDY